MAMEVERLAQRYGIRPGTSEVVGAAAARLGTTPRMLRYREALGLVAPRRTASGYRRYDEQDLLAAAWAGEIEQRYGVTPVAVAFALRALSDHELADELRTLGWLARRKRASPIAALDFETDKARRLLRLAS
jgi:MerR family transcriptional regulator, copper efflux regulator